MRKKFLLSVFLLLTLFIFILTFTPQTAKIVRENNDFASVSFIVPNEFHQEGDSYSDGVNYFSFEKLLLHELESYLVDEQYTYEEDGSITGYYLSDSDNEVRFKFILTGWRAFAFFFSSDNKQLTPYSKTVCNELFKSIHIIH